eukprot:c27748_g1_i1 orf=390-1475(+)
MYPLLRTQDLIPGLPDEIAQQCLMRVSLKCLSAVQSVCRQWRELLNSSVFYEVRRREGYSDLRVCLPQILPESQSCDEKHLIYGIVVCDPKADTWEILPPIPELPYGLPLFCQCVTTDTKLILLGGWNPCSWEAMKCVYIFDFLKATWEKRTDMLAIRSFFACGFMGDLVFVAGGHDDNKNALKTAEVYNLKEDKWQELPRMNQERDECKGVTVNGKFHVISGYTTEAQGQFLKTAEVFDPCTYRWSLVDDIWPTANCPTAVFSFHGQLLAFQKDELRRYDFKSNVWRVVGVIPEMVLSAVCAATALTDSIFICGTKGNAAYRTYAYRPADAAAHVPREWIALQTGDKLNRVAQAACTIQI